MSAEFILTLAGFVVPVAFLLFLWRYASPMMFCASGIVYAVAATLGMKEVIPMFGHMVVGGSTYFPAIFLTIAMCAKRYDGRTALTMVNAMSIAMLLFAAAQFRWYLFAAVAPLETTHSLEKAFIIGRNAVLMTGMVYFGGLLILSIRKWLKGSTPNLRFLVPVVVDIVIMTPVSVWATYTTHHNATHEWFDVTFWTFVTRLAVPLVVLSIIWVMYHYGDDHFEDRMKKEQCGCD